MEVLEEALSARVIEELPQAVGRYQFTHALIRETLSEELSLTRRVRLHARIAETLEELYRDSAEVHAAELAHHFAEAEAISGAEKMVHYSLLAGERALTAYAWEEARSHFQRGLGAKEGQPIDGKTAELLFGLGRAQCSIGQQEEAMDSLRRPFEHYVEVGDVHQAATVAACPAPHLPGQLRGSTQLIDRALALVPPASLDVGHLLSVQCTALGIDQGDYDGGLQAFAQSLAIAQREKDEKLEMQTLARGCSVEAYHLHFEESLQKGRKVIELANQIDDPVCEMTSRFFTAHSLWTKGDLEEARLQAGGCLSLAEQLRDRFWQTMP